ncbi:MAG: sigma 54-interacting transcriptional regulator [Candidatus Krumholzibacteriia bacterium]
MKGRRILIVEDETIVRLHLQRILTDLGCVVTGMAGTAAEALDSCAQDPPDLVLMDIRLPGDRDGIDLGGELRARYGVAVVFVTAYADRETVGRSQEVGAVGYIVKPFNKAEVGAVLATAFAEHVRLRGHQARERSLAAMLGGMGDAIIVTDTEGRVSFLNPQAAALTGWGHEEAINRPIREIIRLVRHDDASVLERLSVSAFEHGVSTTIADVSLVTRDGTEKPIEGELAPLRDSDGTRCGVVLICRDASRREKSTGEPRSAAETGIEAPHGSVRGKARFHDLVGNSPIMVRVFEQIRELSRVDWTVLIEGETGTGKELVAHAIHASSPRRNKPFVAINCAGLTDSLLASQLFGHRRGAFTSAVDDQQGLFEAADGGTLFLDEIGDVSRAVQNSLLRVLEDKQVTRLGESRPRVVDVRLLAATQRDLAAEVEKDNFRADLLFRVRVARIALPPLREREGDVPLLAHWFLGRASRAAGKPIRGLSDETLARLAGYAWPGNVRELRSAIEYAILDCRQGTVQVENLPPEIREVGDVPDGALDEADERERILAALKRARGNRTRAARLIGISRATFYRRLAELGISAGDFPPSR